MHKILKLLKVNDIFKLQELKFYYKFKNRKLPHYLQSLPFHPNTRTHDHDTHIKHKIHNPIGKHVFTKNCVCFDIPRIVNNCPNSILDKVNTHSLEGFSGYIKNKLFVMLPGKLHYNGLLCMQELNLGSHKFYLTYNWHIFSFV